MTDETKKDTLKIGSPNRLTLTKTVDAGKVNQKFTHGRSKSVTVEVRKTRTFAAGTGGTMVEVKQGGQGGGFDDARNLTDSERQARMNAVKSAEEASKLAAERAPQRAAETPAPEPASPTSARARRDNVVMNPLLNRKPAEAATTATPELPPVKPASAKVGVHDDAVADARFARVTEDASKAPGGKLKLKRGEERRNSGKITVTQALGQHEERVRSLASVRRQREKALKKAQSPGAAQEKIIREVIIPEALTVQELANRMAVRAVDVIKVLMKLGMMVTVTQSIDADTAELVVGEFGHTFKRVAESDVENVLRYDVEEDAENLLPRAPVVTIMGHVDHGKTSLLDALRSTDVAAKEAGGITQHIGAYQVELNGGKVTFLDTPGHEAFTAMRARGAKVTDIVVLVVAADDGIMPQTVEAINHAKAAGVPIIVAVNKIDKPDANSARVKTELMQHELVAEEFGGEVIVVEVSAKQRLGLDKLIEAILVQAEVLELKANPNRAGKGVVIESRLDTGRGVVATLLVQRGTLRVGDVVVAGAAYGRIRTLMDDKGRTQESVGPGAPAEIQGLSLPPEAGDVFSVVENEKTARDIAEYREKTNRDTQTKAMAARSIEQLFGEAKEGNKYFNVIVKGDVQGSVEAIAGSVSKFSGDEVSVKILHTGVGAITESDITLARATNGFIIAFNVRATPKAKEMAQRDKVEIRYYSVIYEVVDDIKAAISGMLSPVVKQNFIGYAEIRQIFNMSKYGKVAGCYVTEGMVKRGAGVRLLRDAVVIHEGKLKTLKRFKDEVKEVKSGFECGMAFENYEDIREGDMIEAFETVEEARTI